MEKIGHFFGAKSTCFKLLAFSEIVLMTGINEWVKVTVLNLYGNFILCSKLDKWVIFGTKINTFKVFSKPLH